MIYLNGFVHSHRINELFFNWTIIDVRCVHRGWHGTHHHWWHGTHHHGWHGTQRYGIKICHTRASTWVHWYSSRLQWSVSSGQRGNGGKNTRSLTYPRREKKITGRNVKRRWGPQYQWWVISRCTHYWTSWCSGTDEPHSGSERDFRLTGLWTSACLLM